MFSLISRLLFTSFCFFLLFFSSNSQENDSQKTYIVYMGSHSKGKVSTSSHHIRLLKETIGSTFPSHYLLHSFKRSFNGFVAKFTDDEANKVAEMEGVISVFPNGKKELHTTRSWDFMGLSEQVKRVPTVESNVIVGVFDSGIWPESPSFDHSGYGPPPLKWKGTCEVSANFTCNNKIIGARSYRTSNNELPEGDLKSPRDSDGHGTHTASIVAGGLVRQANMMGLGLGTARGGVPSARIAAYKVCWSDGCTDADILAAFDDAIADGVDIISGSLGGSSIKDYFNDSIAIGSFHAMKKGILTSLAVGNNGPDFTSIVNVSPWSLSVAASTTDRKFETKVKLGNGREFNGVSINTFDLNGKQIPLVYAGDIPKAPFDSSLSRLCFENTVNLEMVKGKIVVCDSLTVAGGVVAVKGAAGIIMQDDSPQDDTNSFPIPASHLRPKLGSLILSYINSTKSVPTASIMKSIERKRKRAPFIASFSSRGPNPITPNILKPDLSGPGVEILAAWPSKTSPSGAEEDNRRVNYNILSGTSMACPHVTAAAAYVKSFHPTWSPAALKSALMTTAFPMSPKRNPDEEFGYGAGHVNPYGAVHPGLIFDASEIDYVKFLCGQGYTTELLQRVSEDNNICSPNNTDTVFDLNYPSFALSTNISKPIDEVYRRIVTNVGSKFATYKATIINPWKNLEIKVKPSVLSFKNLGEKQSFEVTIKGRINKNIESASLVWDDGKHKVRSPITIFDSNIHSSNS